MYLDAREHKYIEECGAANFFGIKDGKYITPKSPSILPSITNMSLRQLAEDMGLKVEERPVPVDELDTFEEAGACGTAAVISPIESVYDLDTWQTRNLRQAGRQDLPCTLQQVAGYPVRTLRGQVRLDNRRRGVILAARVILAVRVNPAAVPPCGSCRGAENGNFDTLHFWRRSCNDPRRIKIPPFRAVFFLAVSGRVFSSSPYILIDFLSCFFFGRCSTWNIYSSRCPFLFMFHVEPSLFPLLIFTPRGTSLCGKYMS